LYHYLDMSWFFLQIPTRHQTSCQTSLMNLKHDYLHITKFASPRAFLVLYTYGTIFNARKLEGQFCYD
jgi:hypothetical protein